MEHLCVKLPNTLLGWPRAGRLNFHNSNLLDTSPLDVLGEQANQAKNKIILLVQLLGSSRKDKRRGDGTIYLLSVLTVFKGWTISTINSEESSHNNGRVVISTIVGLHRLSFTFFPGVSMYLSAVDLPGLEDRS